MFFIMHLSFLCNFFIFFKMCICSIYKVLVLDLFLVVLILQLIASILLICKSLWIKASAT